MKILITGSEGYIGSRLKKKIQDLGIGELFLIDLKKGNDLMTAKLPDVDIVFHLSAQSGAIPSIENPIWDARTNILTTIRLAEHYKGKAKIIYTTSGGAKDPESPYGLSKKVGEEYLKMIHNNTVICRLSSIYGGKDRGVVDNFIRDEVPTVFGDGSAVRDFVHVDDIIEGLIKAMDWEAVEYEMGSGIGTSVKEIADATGKQIQYLPVRKGEKQEAILQNTTPNWKPEIEVLFYIKSLTNK